MADFGNSSGAPPPDHADGAAALREELLRKQERIAGLEAELAEAERLKADALAKLGARTNELRSQRAEVATLQRQIEQIHQSTSWRVTAPLREFKRGGLVRSAWLRATGRPLPPPVPKKTSTPVQDTLRRMLTLGFEEQGLADLMRFAASAEPPELRAEAAWELAAWHLNQETELHAREALRLLPAALGLRDEPDLQRKHAIMLAEAEMRTGEAGRAREMLEKEIRRAPHPDLFLAQTALETDPAARIRHVNDALAACGLSPVGLSEAVSAAPYDRLEAVGRGGRVSDGPLVSIVMPAFDAERSIATAIRSVQAQTWRTFELLVVDDCSSDGTAGIVSGMAESDPRIRLLAAPRNGGPYVARNIALAEASGEFLTCNDADDWSHPEKIERQVRALIGNRRLAGTLSQQARATPDLVFHRRSKPGQFIFPNLSSLMVRRKPVFERLGAWDSVRFGADSEFLRRVTLSFGEGAVETLPPVPLSFQQLTRSSLTGSARFGYPGFFFGARKAYLDAYRAHHGSGAALHYDFPQVARPFPVPEPMLPVRKAADGERRRFDVILASEFRLKGGSNRSNIEEIGAMRQAGLKVGLVQMSRYDLPVTMPVNPDILALVDGELVEMLVYGEEVACDLLVVRYPPVLQDRQRWLPDIEARDVRVIVNQSPESDYGPTSVLRYEIPQASSNLRHYFGLPGEWHPIGPAVREALHAHHEAELASIALSDQDWVNIIDVSAWKRKARPARLPGRPGRIRIGRHSRDHEMKWPERAADILALYPDHAPFEVHVLGGADVPIRRLGRKPRTWHVVPFGGQEPQAFLQNLDVFVYFTHSAWVEAFGRVVLEAMATGVPVILPQHYAKLFKNAALYGGVPDVQDLIGQLMGDDVFYRRQVETAFEYAEEHFGYGCHRARISPLVARLQL